jgi:hypothetical protein
MKGGVEPIQANSFFELLGSIKEKRSHSNQEIYPNADEAAKKKAPNTKKRVVFFWLSLVMRAAHVFFLPQLGSMHSCVFLASAQFCVQQLWLFLCTDFLPRPNRLVLCCNLCLF